MRNPVASTFRSLRTFNFRLWTAGSLVSNVGSWMQRVAQDRLVLTQLSEHDASGLGIVMGLQFAPQLLCPCPAREWLRTALTSASSL